MKRLREILQIDEMVASNPIRANDPDFKIEDDRTIDNIDGADKYVQLLHHDKKGAPPVETEHGHHIYYSHELLSSEKNIGVFKMALVDPKTKSVDFHVQGPTILHSPIGKNIPEWTLEELHLKSKDKDKRAISNSNSHPLYRTIMRLGGILNHYSMSDGAKKAYKRFHARYNRNIVHWDQDRKTGQLLPASSLRFNNPRYNRQRMYSGKERFSPAMRRDFFNKLHQGTD